MYLPNIAIAGATGLVGRTMLDILKEKKIRYSSIRLLASSRSAGQHININDEQHTVQELNKDSFQDIDIALFSCGGDTSKKYAPIAVQSGAIVIDNSSAWRMHPNVPLVVPEVNSSSIPSEAGIIANPNCSTIQLVVALRPIHALFGLKKVICSTYQSISGAGQSGVDRLQAELQDPSLNKGKRIAFSTLFHQYQSNGRTDEENKMLNETRKIMDIPELDISVTCVRLPILGGHAESIWLETEKPIEIELLKRKFDEEEGIVFSDNFHSNEYPTPETAAGQDPVFISRLKTDPVFTNGLSMWVVADNLRKGAATNAVQIAENIISNRTSTL